MPINSLRKPPTGRRISAGAGGALAAGYAFAATVAVPDSTPVELISDAVDWSIVAADGVTPANAAVFVSVAADVLDPAGNPEPVTFAQLDLIADGGVPATFATVTVGLDPTLTEPRRVMTARDAVLPNGHPQLQDPLTLSAAALSSADEPLTFENIRLWWWIYRAAQLDF